MHQRSDDDQQRQALPGQDQIEYQTEKYGGTRQFLTPLFRRLFDGNPCNLLEPHRPGEPLLTPFKDFGMQVLSEAPPGPVYEQKRLGIEQ